MTEFTNMPPESLVATREICLRLKEKGWDAPTHFLWHAGHPFGAQMVPYLTTGPKPTSEYFLAWAPTLAEVLEQLRRSGVTLSISWAEAADGTWCWFAEYDEPGVQFAQEAHDSNPAEAAALLWEKVDGSGVA